MGPVLERCFAGQPGGPVRQIGAVAAGGVGGCFVEGRGDEALEGSKGNTGRAGQCCIRATRQVFEHAGDEHLAADQLTDDYLARSLSFHLRHQAHGPSLAAGCDMAAAVPGLRRLMWWGGSWAGRLPLRPTRAAGARRLSWALTPTV